jgi:hypothetical protein
MSETNLGEADGTDDIGQLVGFNLRSFWLIILKNAYFLWNIVGVLGLVFAWKVVPLCLQACSRCNESKKKKKKKHQDDYDQEPHERVERPSRGRSRHRDEQDD